MNSYDTNATEIPVISHSFENMIGQWEPVSDSGSCPDLCADYPTILAKVF